MSTAEGDAVEASSLEAAAPGFTTPRPSTTGALQRAGSVAGITLRIQRPRSPGSPPPPRSPSSPLSPLRTPRSPGSRLGSPTRSLGTARSWSSLDTVHDTFGDPVGTFRDLTFNARKDRGPPFRFGSSFESDGERRQNYSEQTFSMRQSHAIPNHNNLGPAEERPGSSHFTRDTECASPLLHSSLPATLRPTPRHARGIHATPKQPKAQAMWQPASVSPAWHTPPLTPQPYDSPTPSPVPPDEIETAMRSDMRMARANDKGKWREAPDHMRQHVLALRRPPPNTTTTTTTITQPKRYSSKMMCQLRDESPPLSTRYIKRLVGERRQLVGVDDDGR